MIVVASWRLYRYLAPKTWKEWTSAGVVQAFIIVLAYYLLARSVERKVEEEFGDAGNTEPLIIIVLAALFLSERMPVGLEQPGGQIKRVGSSRPIRSDRKIIDREFDLGNQVRCGVAP